MHIDRMTTTAPFQELIGGTGLFALYEVVKQERTVLNNILIYIYVFSSRNIIRCIMTLKHKRYKDLKTSHVK
jgi:hypothetical protein